MAVNVSTDGAELKTVTINVSLTVVMQTTLLNCDWLTEKSVEMLHKAQNMSQNWDTN